MTPAHPTSIGARVNLPRDSLIAYALGRFGASTIEPLWPIHFGSYHTGRRRIRHLVRLKLVRRFPRRSPSEPLWYSLTRQGMEFVLEHIGCPPEEVQQVASINRLNLGALAERNHLWSSLIRAARRSPTVRLALFRPERELRRMAMQAVPPISVVPDALFCLELRTNHDPSSERDVPRLVAMVELDSGSERSSQWRVKARSYRAQSALYGAERWSILVTVPSIRRARTIAEAVSNEGLGNVTYLALATHLRDGHALERVLWRADELLVCREPEPGHSLLDLLSVPHPAQRAGATDERGSSAQCSSETGLSKGV